MYLQIIEQIKQRIAVGDWVPGQQIPSIRQLAVDLEISIITVKRAYLELEREGIIQTRHGKGSQVAQAGDLGSRLREAELAQHLEQVAKLGTMMGLGFGDLEQRLRAATDQVFDKELK
ncbi:MAG: GntR family transcriptional regulator [Bryobacterales bacterium]|nr:GntR family transcriptional regulator [Bryobacterales bacterium]